MSYEHYRKPVTRTETEAILNSAVDDAARTNGAQGQESEDFLRDQSGVSRLFRNNLPPFPQISGRMAYVSKNSCPREKLSTE